MKARSGIQALIKKLNEGSIDSGRAIAQMYQDECVEQYSKMMRSLSLIKVLRIEIETYVAAS